jgi:dTDP-glucose 4,6-dehydratase
MKSDILNEFITADCQALLERCAPEDLAKLRNSSLLITGAGGFLGSWLTRVVLFLNENFSYNTELVLHSKKTPHLADKKNVVSLRGDIRNLLEMPASVQWVIHAASSPDARTHISDPINTLEVLGNGTNAVLSATTRLPALKKFLYVSSGLVYGAENTPAGRAKENAVGGPALNTVSSVYAEGKRFAESLVTAYRSLYKIPTTVVRPFTFLGPFQNLEKPWAMNNFIRDALVGGPIRIFGNPENLRTFMYGTDFAWWTLKALTNGATGSSYNIGAAKPFSILETAKRVSSAMTAPVQIELCPSGNPLRSDLVPDVTQAETMLNLKTTVELDQAIQRTIAWHKLQGTATR